VNRQRRDRIGTLIEAMTACQHTVDEIAIEEREQFDALTDKAQDDEKGAAIDASANDLEEVATKLDDLISTLEQVLVTH
jgi:hypothetical protein